MELKQSDYQSIRAIRRAYCVGSRIQRAFKAGAHAGIWLDTDEVPDNTATFVWRIKPMAAVTRTIEFNS